ncbi:MAG TPA: inositol oxygenase family protein [Pirellulales bacterium]|nr:inositol oxygenase family protein [Pirellulales bacterium]
MADLERHNVTGPLGGLDEWEDDLRRRYPSPAEVLEADKSSMPRAFRDYRAETRPQVKEFYRLHHRHQTVDFVRAKRDEYLSGLPGCSPAGGETAATDRGPRRQMGIWEALEFLNTLVDDSDPDTSLAQIEHCLQTAEAIRDDGRPRWFILTGLIHDLGKILCLFGEPQWAVVGDTFPVGCAWSDAIVFQEFLAENADAGVPDYQTRCGIYAAGCGLDNVLMTWGHDEYLYHVVRDYLPREALYMIRYHSFYPGHREGAYAHLMNDADRQYFPWVKAFSPYDLYTKSAERPDVAALRPYYEDLVAEFFPPTLVW